MNNYPYPKSSAEFFSRAYSIDQIVNNYDLDNLFKYLPDGYKVLGNIQTILNNELYEELGISKFQVEKDLDYFRVRIFVLKTAIRKISSMEVLEFENGLITLVCTN